MKETVMKVVQLLPTFLILSVLRISGLKLDSKKLEASEAINKMIIVINAICSNDDCSSSDSKDKLLSCFDVGMIDTFQTCVSKVVPKENQKNNCDANTRNIVKYCVFCSIVTQKILASSIDKVTSDLNN